MTKQKTMQNLGRFGEPSILILLSISHGPKHGYAMIIDIETETGIRLGPGTLYGAIIKLVEKGMIVKVATSDRRQPYMITDTGKHALREYVNVWAPIISLTKRRLA
jgi:DNA-binding PadR family transcriptional regulator